MIRTHEPTPAAAAASQAFKGDSAPFTSPAQRYATAIPWAEVGQALKTGGQVVRHRSAEFADFIYRMLRALFVRIARLFGVSVATPGEGSSVPQAESAAFAGQNGEKVADAGVAAASELGRVSDAVKDLLGRDLDADQLSGDGAQAYARLVLGRMCSAINDLQDRAQRLDGQLAAHAAQMARELGTPVSSVRAMLDQAVAGSASTGLGDPQAPELAAAIDVARRLAKTRLELGELAATLALHAASVISAAGERTAVVDTVWQTMELVADPLLRGEVAAQTTAQKPEHSSSSGVHFAKHKGATQDEAVPTVSANTEPESSSNVLELSGRIARSRLARYRSAGTDGEPEGPGPTPRDRG